MRDPDKATLWTPGNAIELVETLAQGSEKLSEWQIKSIHQLVLKYLDDENAGTYRTINVLIAGAQHRPSSFLQVPFEMTDFMEQYHTQWVTQHPVERATRVHSELVKIHPFADGNGRTARLLMNLELLKAGFPAVVLPVEQRLTYYETLDKAHVERDYEPFFSLIEKLVEESFAAYWYALGIE